MLAVNKTSVRHRCTIVEANNDSSSTVRRCALTNVAFHSRFIRKNDVETPTSETGRQLRRALFCSTTGQCGEAFSLAA